MIYINEAKYRQNNGNRQIGWVINESAPDEELAAETKIVKTMFNGRRVVGSGILQRVSSKNRNGRWYDASELFPQLTCPRTQELLRANDFCSENGHPMSSDLQRQATIDPNNVVARQLKFWTDGDLIRSEFIGTNLPIGEAFDQDLRDGVLPAWSLRALGSVENTTRGAEVKGIKLITYDKVLYPSHPEAYTDGLVHESALPDGFVKTESGILIRTKEMTREELSICENGRLTPIVNQSVLDCIQQESTNFNNYVRLFDTFYDSIALVNEGKQVQLTNASTGDLFIINLEQYVHNEIMDYCTK